MDIKKATIAFGLMAAVYASAAISSAPVTNDATESAKKLYNFLAMNYGARTISGIMTGDLGNGEGTDVTKTIDVQAVNKVTGKDPALVGFDFLFATGKKSDDSWYKAYTQNTITLAKDLWNKGGIPAFTWHWKDPSGEVESYKPEEIKFKFENAYTLSGSTLTWNTSSTEYQQLVRDIEVIAGYFLQLQEAGVAAIWRPLHEASGNISNGGKAWFWWGDKGAIPCTALYNLIYDTFATKGVKNLIWDWNPQMANDQDWNPGNTHYDVLTLDIYGATDYSTKFVTGYKDLVTSFGSDKILAISENGPIPDYSAMKENNTVYSWWMMWYESPTWEGYFVTKQNAPAVLKANMESPCTITLSDMPGWDKYTISNTPVAACDAGYNLADLDKTIPVEEVKMGDGWMKVVVKNIDTKDGILLDYQPKTKQTGVNSVSITFKNQSNDGIWIGLAIVTDGDGTPTWQWEMSKSDGCWLNGGDSTTCTFDMTKYDEKDENGKVIATHDMDADRIFKYTFMLSAGNGYSGTLWASEFKSNAGDISKFATSADLFTEGDKVGGLVGIYLGNENTEALHERNTKISSSITLQGNSLAFTTALAGNVSLDVFDLQGNRVANLYKGALSAGTHQFNLSGMARGSYLVRAKGAGLSATKRIVIK